VRLRRLPRGDRRAATAFVDLPYRLYERTPQWAPDGLYTEQFRRMQPGAHPFYAHSEADFFVVEEGGEVVGRVAAIDNRRFNEHKGTAEAFFGYFESVDDSAVTARLLDAVMEWASRRDLDTVSGPRGLLGFDGSVLVEGFEHPAVVGVPWNPPHYGPAIEASGFAPDEDYLSGFMTTDIAIPQAVFDLADKVVARGTYSVKHFTSSRELRAWAPRLKEAYLASVSELASFYPPTDAEIDDLVGTVLSVADPRGIKLVMSDDEIAGFLFCYPDLAPALRATGGRLWPLGWATLLRARSQSTHYCINGLGMLPEHRGRGGNAVLYAAITRTAIDEIGMVGAEVVQVAEHNTASIKDMAKLGTVWQKRHRRYRHTL
jgi:GNAT superfamily N-acetyltransferase